MKNKKTIVAICERYEGILRKIHVPIEQDRCTDRLSNVMDLTVMNNEFPTADLTILLESPDHCFMHDMGEMKRHIDRSAVRNPDEYETGCGAFPDWFCPRYVSASARS